MNKIKSVARKTKNHVQRQKWAYAWGCVAFAAISLQQSNLKTFFEFLDEKGIDRNEFLNPEMFEEQK